MSASTAAILAMMRNQQEMLPSRQSRGRAHSPAQEMITKEPALESAIVQQEKITPELQAYLKTFSPKAETFPEVFERLEIDAVEAGFFCPVTRDVPAIPVRVGSEGFDYSTLIKLSILPDGSRANPVTYKPFNLEEVQPDLEMKKRIEGFIAAKEDMLPQSAPKF